MAKHTLTTGPEVVSSTRRRLLSSAAAALTGTTLAAMVLSPDPTWGAADATIDPDAKLLVLCDRFHAIDREVQALDGCENKAAEAERAACWDRQEPLIDEMAEVGATTLAGFRALARAYATWDAPEVDGLLQSGLIGDTLLGTLLRDLTAVWA